MLTVACIVTPALMCCLAMLSSYCEGVGVGLMVLLNGGQKKQQFLTFSGGSDRNSAHGSIKRNCFPLLGPGADNQRSHSVTLPLPPHQLPPKTFLLNTAVA